MSLDGFITPPTFRPDGGLACLNFGGGGKATVPKPPKTEPIKFPKMPEIRMPETPAPVATAPTPPPPTATSAEVAQAEEQQMRDAKKRKGLRKTVLAGETGGYSAQLGGGTILGGSASANPSAPS